MRNRLHGWTPEHTIVVVVLLVVAVRALAPADGGIAGLVQRIGDAVGLRCGCGLLDRL